MSSRIGQAQEYHGVEVLALAPEVYAAGFVATCQIQSLGAGPDLGDADDAERSPRLALSATDHRGGHYTSAPYEGSGFGQRRDWQWRGASCLTPALDPAAHTLRLTLAALEWTRPDAAPRRFVPAHTICGPRRFTVALAHAVGAPLDAE